MDTKPRFSVVMIAKNEEKTLPHILDSLKQFKERGGEILLVDTGSTDNTKIIAAAAGVTVFDEPGAFSYPIDQEMADKINSTFIVEGEAPIVKAGDRYFDFGEARQHAMSLASNDWVLCPGCDEVFKNFDIDRIHEFIDKGFSQLRVDYIWNQDPNGRPRTRFFRDSYLFDRTKWHWSGSIHECVMEIQPGEKWTNLPEEVVLVEHHQQPDASRNNRDAVGLAVSCLKDPTNDRHSHYFARELMFQKRYRSSIREFQRHVKLGGWDLERGQSLTFIGDCYWFLGNLAEAVRFYHESFQFCSKRRAPLMRLAELYYRSGDHQRTACYAMAALQIPYLPYYANDMAHYRHYPHELLYWALWYLGDREGSKYHLRKCLEYEPDNPKFKEEGARLLNVT